MSRKFLVALRPAGQPSQIHRPRNLPQGYPREISSTSIALSCLILKIVLKLSEVETHLPTSELGGIPRLRFGGQRVTNPTAILNGFGIYLRQKWMKSPVEILAAGPSPNGFAVAGQAV